VGKKNKKQKLTVYGVVEDQQEFIQCLKEIYQSKENNIHVDLKNSEGGKPDRIVSFAIKECQRHRSFAWLDEDFEPADPLSNNVRIELAKLWKVELDSENSNNFLSCPLRDLQATYNPNNKKPVVIISQPVCSESLIIQALGETIPDSCKIYNPDPIQRDKQIKGLKDKLKKIIGKSDRIDFYRQKLDKPILEERRKLIPELDLLISMITK